MQRIHKKILGLILFIFVAAFWGAAGLHAQEQAASDEPLVLDEIVAKVNNEIITLVDLRKAIEDLRLSLEEEIQDTQKRNEVFENEKKALLKGMIRNKVMLQRADDLGVSANIDADVAKYMEEWRKQAGIPNMEVLDQALRQRGSSLTEYRQRIKEKMIIESLLGQFVYSKITLLTPEIRAFYEEHRDQFTTPAQVKLAEILFLTEGKDEQSVRQNAEEVLAKIREGASFEEMAKQYSDGPSASSGGSIGTFQKGTINEALEEFAFSNEEGAISGIIKTDYGFQIIKVLEHTKATVRPMDEVRPQIAEALYQRKAQPELKEFMENLLEQSYIFVDPKYAQQYDVEGIIG